MGSLAISTGVSRGGLGHMMLGCLACDGPGLGLGGSSVLWSIETDPERFDSAGGQWL